MSEGEPLRAGEVEVEVSGGRRILGPVSLTAAPGQLTAVLGPSGSGKSTLLRVLAGLAEPTSGVAQLGEDPVGVRIDQIGYVPQRETVHDRLTVQEALEYAARLRLGPGAEAGRSVEQVLTELDLGDRRHTWIRDLSGGERRRAACGLELVGDLRVLLLDEPTSGLDPVLERRLTLMFRRLADRGRSVVVSTHTSASLDVCDSVLVLQADGSVAFSGPPAAAQEHLSTVVRTGEEREAAHHASRAAAPGPRERNPAARRRSFGLEFGTLFARYTRTLLRDRRTLAALLAQAPVIGLLIAIPFHTASLLGSSAAPAQLEQVVFLIMTAAIWLGITTAAQEVVKERGIIERELDVGLRIDAYVLAKAVALFALAAVQVALVDVVVFAIRLRGEGAGALLELFALGVVVAWASASLGLAVSAAVRSAAQATGVVPLLLIPQLLFAGALIPLAQMPRLVQGLADLTFARWAYAAMGGAVGLPSSLGSAGDAASALGVDPSFFSLTVGTGLVILVVFALIFLLIAAAVLTRRVVDPVI